MISTALVALVALARPAGAVTCPGDPSCCSSLSNPIYAQVGDTQTNLMRQMGRALRDNTPEPVTLVFITSGSCTNIDDFYNHTAPITATMQYAPSVEEDPTWNPVTSPTLTCTPDPGQFPDIGNSALYISGCTSQAVPATVFEELGAIQAYVLAVPRASDQVAITFEEAYFVFGFGMAGVITPWTDETQMFIRTVTKSTLLTWAANIAVPGNLWKGVRFDGSPQVVAALQTSADPEAAIGILGAEVYDADRDTLKELAFRSKDQYAAYFADSTATSFDKQNIRDGHYTVWSPTVWMINTDDNGSPIKQDAKNVIDMISGHPVTPAPNFDADVLVAKVGLVPDCAMRVQRTAPIDGSALSLYKPDTSCTCKFLSIVDETTCFTCNDQNPCTSGVCRNGYCEEF
jgi:hypothetical protein